MMYENYNFKLPYSFCFSVFVHAAVIFFIFYMSSTKKDIIYVDIPVELIRTPVVNNPIVEDTTKKVEEKKQIVKELKKTEKVPIPKITETKKEIIKDTPKVVEPSKEIVKEIEEPVVSESVESKQKTQPRTRSRVENVRNNQPAFKPNIRVDNNFPYTYYLKVLQKKISDNWSPSVVGNLIVVVYFKIYKQGNVDEIKIDQSSGNVDFDQAAIRAVKSSSPFPPLPYEYEENFLGVYFGFEYKN